MVAKMRGTLTAVAVLILSASVSANAPEVKTPAAHVDQAAHNLRTDTIPPQTDVLTTTVASTTTTSEPVTSHLKLVAASVDDIVHQTKLGAQFLKTAAQLTKMLSEEEKKKMKDDSLAEATHDIVGYAKTLLASMGQGEKAASKASSAASSSSDSWTLRGSHSKPRPVCTVTSGYWDRECECEFIPKEKRPHRPRPDEDDEDDDGDDDDHHHRKPTTTEDLPPPPPRRPKPRPSRPQRPVNPWNYGGHYPRPEYFYPEQPRPEYERPHGHYRPRPRPEYEEHEEEEEYEERPRPSYNKNPHQHRPDPEDLSDRVENLVEHLSGLLDSLSHRIESIHHHPSSNFEVLRTEQREQLIRAPLAQVSKLRSIVKNQKVLRKVKSSGGQAMERFLKQKVADVEAMVNYPDYMADQLKKTDGKQPLVLQMQTIIDRLEPLSY